MLFDITFNYQNYKAIPECTVFAALDKIEKGFLGPATGFESSAYGTLKLISFVVSEGI